MQTTTLLALLTLVAGTQAGALLPRDAPSNQCWTCPQNSTLVETGFSYCSGQPQCVYEDQATGTPLQCTFWGAKWLQPPGVSVPEDCPTAAVSGWACPQVPSMTLAFGPHTFTPETVTCVYTGPQWSALECQYDLATGSPAGFNVFPECASTQLVCGETQETH